MVFSWALLVALLLTIYKHTHSITQAQVLFHKYKPTDSGIKQTSGIYRAKWEANYIAHNTQTTAAAALYTTQWSRASFKA